MSRYSDTVSSRMSEDRPTAVVSPGVPASNPWIRIDPDGAEPYVLPEDWKYIEAYNKTLFKDGVPTRPWPPTYIDTDLMPEPWLGRRNAPVCLLLLNPGVGDGDGTLHANPEFRRRLAAAVVDDDAPHFHLVSPPSSPGRKWWNAALSTLARELELGDPGALMNAVSCVQLFPYHSASFDHLGIRLPSQAATVKRVRDQLARGTILLVRSWASWLGLVPELADPEHAGRVFPLKGRCVRVHASSVGGEEKFRSVVDAVRRFNSTAAANMLTR